MMSEPLGSKEAVRNIAEEDRDRPEEGPIEGLMLINPQGARIERLTFGGRLILRSVVRGDGKNFCGAIGHESISKPFLNYLFCHFIGNHVCGFTAFLARGYYFLQSYWYALNSVY